MKAWLAANPDDEPVESAGPRPAPAAVEPSPRTLAPNFAIEPSVVTTLIRIGLAALAVAAMSLWIGLAPDADYDKLRQEVASRSEANNVSTESAMQQEVVNGWETNDYLELLTVQVEQGNNRRDALLGAILLAIVLVGSASVSGSRDRGH